MSLIRKINPKQKESIKDRHEKGNLDKTLNKILLFNFNNGFIDFFSQSTHRILDNRTFNHLVMKISL